MRAFKGLVALVLAVVLCGCAATVKKGAVVSAIQVPRESTQRIVLNIDGPPRSVQSRDWETFKNEWQGAFSTLAGSNGFVFEVQNGPVKPLGEPGTLVAMWVDDYRYISTAARIGLGIMIGNAYVESKVRFLDLRDGHAFGQQDYNTRSSAAQGIFSAMTSTQVEAIAREIVDEIRGNGTVRK